MRLRSFAALALLSSVSSGLLVDPSFESGPADNTSPPSAPWNLTCQSGDLNPIYLWSSGGSLPPATKALVFKDGNGPSMPDYLWQTLSNLTAEQLSNVSLTFDAGWRGSLPGDTASFRIELWNLTDRSVLSSAEIGLPPTSAISDRWTQVDGDPSRPGIQPFTVGLSYDASAADLAGDAVALRIGRVDPDNGLGADNWRSSAWIDRLSLTADVRPPDVSDAPRQLLQRILPALSDRIVFEHLPDTPGDAFRLGHSGNRVVIAGTNTNARAAGLHQYLKHHCGMHFSWSGDQTAIPDPLPLPDDPVRTSPWKWRSAHNHCVFSYSMAFWDWPRWEREIDFLALNGVNQAFLLTGHEKVWQNTLRRLGFSDAQIATWLPSTSHISWWHFDNLQGEGGPISQHEIDQEAALARQAADRMRSLGIEPVALGFYGMVPDFFGSRFPQARLIPQGNWVGSYARPPVLDPSDPAFASTAAIYYEELENLLGPVRHYAGDLFHEGGQTGGLDLATAFRKVQDAMLAHTPDAVWVMFGWQSNPRTEGLAQLLPEHVLIQQTSIHPATAIPVSGSFRDYSGRIPWTWHLIDNFGGNHGLYGNFDTLASLPSRFLQGRAPGRFSGIGHAPEGIETNPLQAALFYEMFWRDQDLDPAAWLDGEISRRYGKSSIEARQAWRLLARSSYRCPVAQEGISDLVFAARPRPDAGHARTWATNTPYWSELDIVEAWRLLLEAAPELSGNPNFRYDLVDVTRHTLNFHSKHVLDSMMTAFRQRDRAAFDDRAAAFLSLFDDLDSLLATDPRFLLGTWLERARAKGHDAESRHRIERNARNLVTLWNGRSDSLDDYASRSWSGLVGSYYKSRWNRYIQDLRNHWASSGTPAYSGLDLELAFLDDRTSFPATAAGDTTALSSAIYQRLSAAMRRHASLRWSVPQERADDVTLRFDVTERLAPAQTHRVSISRQFGDAPVTLGRIALVRADGSPLEEHDTPHPLTATPATFIFQPLSQPPSRILLEITLSGPGNRAVANGPIDLEPFFETSRRDYVGRFQYSAGGQTYYRELRADGTVGLYLENSAGNLWNGYTWQFVDGEARLFKADGSLFERHRLRDRQTLLFQVEPHLGPGIRMPLTSFYHHWSREIGLAALAADPHGDFDADGLSNLSEFLFGTDPASPEPQIALLNRRILWKQRREADLEGIDYRLEHSSDLRSWTSWTGAIASSVSPTPGYLEFSCPLPSGDGASFFRAAAGPR